MCGIARFAISLPSSYLAAIGRPARDDPAENGRTGAPPPLQGSLPSSLSLRESSEHRPQAGAEALEASPMKWHYPILIFAGLCCSAWGFLYRPFPIALTISLHLLRSRPRSTVSPEPPDSPI